MKKRTLATALLLQTLIANAGDQNTIKNTIKGTDTNDVLNGSDGIDIIFGGEGNDKIESGKGSDIVYGGPGADTFVVKLINDDSFDTVMDFDPSENDTVLFDFSDALKQREAFYIPEELSYRNISLDRKGNVSVRLTNNENRTFLNIKQSDLNMVVEDKGRTVQVRFMKTL